ncbi:hypothetical protein FGRMN_3083 [Fusarium graminum]|nr:hypothetical protein FGRMN_3083 [Fusarium graminum]
MDTTPAMKIVSANPSFGDHEEHNSVENQNPVFNPHADPVKAAARITIKRPASLLPTEPYRGDDEFLKYWELRRWRLKKSTQAIQEPVRKEETHRANILLRVINHFQVPWENVSFCELTSELHWPGKFYHMQELTKHGAMARLENMEVPEHPDKRRRLSTDDYGFKKISRRVSKMAQVTYAEDANNSTKIMDPKLVNDIRQLLDENKVKSSVWNDLELHLKSHYPCFGEARRCLQHVSNRLIYRMDKVMAPENDKNFSGELDDLIRLMLLAAGVFHMHEVDWLDYTEDWKGILETFYRMEPKLSAALEAVKANTLLDVEYIGPMLAPAIADLKNAACIIKQRALYTEIRTLLYGNLKVAGRWIDGEEPFVPRYLTYQ